MSNWGNALSAGFGAIADVGKLGVISEIDKRHQEALARVRHQYRSNELEQQHQYRVKEGKQTSESLAAKEKELAKLKHQQAMELQGAKDRAALERAQLTQSEKAPKQVYAMQDGGKITLADIIKLYQAEFQYSEYEGYKDPAKLADFAASIGVIDFSIPGGTTAAPRQSMPNVDTSDMSPEEYNRVKRYFMGPDDLEEQVRRQIDPRTPTRYPQAQ